MALVSCDHASAELVSFRLQGSVSVVSEFPLQSGIANGAPFTALISYETELFDESPDDPQRGSYLASVGAGQIAMRFEVGSLKIVSDPSSVARIGLHNDAAFLAGTGEPADYLTLSVPSLGGLSTMGQGLSLSLLDLSGDAWASKQLPAEIDLNFLDMATITAYGGIGSSIQFYSILGTVTSIVKVPEPSSISIAFVLLSVAPLARYALALRAHD